MKVGKVGELIASLLGEGLGVRVEARGGSMEPAIPGGSVVTISPVAKGRALAPGDVVLTRAPGGRLKLHRLLRRRGGRVVTRGDYARGNDTPVSESFILGVARGMPRAGASAWFAPVWAELSVSTRAGLERRLIVRYQEPEEVRDIQARAPAGLEPWEETLARCLSPGARILDIGCGGGREALALARRGFRVTAADPVAEAFPSAASEGILFQSHEAMDLLDPALLPGPFDAVLLTRGLYSCLPLRKRRTALLRALGARLAPGGILAFAAYEAAPRLGPRALLVRLGRGFLQAARPSRFYWERGDRMLRYVTESGRGGGWLFCHLFAPGETAAECRAAGFSRVERGEDGAVLAMR